MKLAGIERGFSRLEIYQKIDPFVENTENLVRSISASLLNARPIPVMPPPVTTSTGPVVQSSQRRDLTPMVKDEESDPDDDYEVYDDEGLIPSSPFDSSTQSASEARSQIAKDEGDESNDDDDEGGAIFLIALTVGIAATTYAVWSVVDHFKSLFKIKTELEENKKFKKDFISYLNNESESSINSDLGNDILEISEIKEIIYNRSLMDKEISLLFKAALGGSGVTLAWGGWNKSSQVIKIGVVTLSLVSLAILFKWGWNYAGRKNEQDAKKLVEILERIKKRNSESDETPATSRSGSTSSSIFRTSYTN